MSGIYKKLMLPVGLLLTALPIYLFQQSQTEQETIANTATAAMQARSLQLASPDGPAETNKTIRKPKEPTKTVVAPPKSPQQIDKQTAQRLLATHPSAIQERIFRKDPFIKRFRYLTTTKVLLSEDEKNEVAAMVTNQAKINSYFHGLNQPLEEQNLDDNQIERLFALNYLAEAMKHQSMTSQTTIATSMYRLLIVENIDSNLPTKAKKALAYEKIKILRILSRHAPEFIGNLSQQLTDHPYNKIYARALSQKP